MTKRYPGQPESMAKMNRLYILADHLGIESFIRRRSSTEATQLDGRAIQGVFEAFATYDDLAALSKEERALLEHLGTDIDDA